MKVIHADTDPFDQAKQKGLFNILMYLIYLCERIKDAELS